MNTGVSAQLPVRRWLRWRSVGAVGANARLMRNTRWLHGVRNWPEPWNLLDGCPGYNQFMGSDALVTTPLRLARRNGPAVTSDFSLRA
jgi:hypothetical protein